MARFLTNTVEYFPHFANASEKRTVTVLETKYGLAGYCAWFKLLECLAKTDGHAIYCRNDVDYQYLSSRLHIDNGQLKNILNTLSDLSAIDQELWNNNHIIWSDNFVKQIAIVYHNRKREPPVKPSNNHQSTSNLPVIYPQSVERGERGERVEDSKESKVEKVIGEDSTNLALNKNNIEIPKNKDITYVKTDENGEPIKEKVKKNKKPIDPLTGEKAKEVFSRLDALRGYVNGAIRGGENKAVLQMLKTYSPEQIIKVWQMMKSEEFWKNKELNMMSVQKQIGAKLKYNPQNNQPQVDRMEGMREND
jgi:Domain of unknown function (DUF4373)